MHRIHYAPTNISVSPADQTIKEKHRPPQPFTCHATSYPRAKYFWQFENGTRTKTGNKLAFNAAIRRSDGGTYTCTAFNKLGNIKAEGEQSLEHVVLNIYCHRVAVKMNVLFKPECQIKKHVNDKVLFLKCVVEANPANVTYYWYHNDNIMSGR